MMVYVCMAPLPLHTLLCGYIKQQRSFVDHKMQSPEQPLEPDSKSEAIKDSNIKNSNFRAEITMFTSWFLKNVTAFMARFSFHINFRAGDFDYGQNLKIVLDNLPCIFNYGFWHINI